MPDQIMDWVQASVDELTAARNTLKVRHLTLPQSLYKFPHLTPITFQLQADNLKDAHHAAENAMEVRNLSFPPILRCEPP